MVATARVVEIACAAAAAPTAATLMAPLVALVALLTLVLGGRMGAVVRRSLLQPKAPEGGGETRDILVGPAAAAANGGTVAARIVREGIHIKASKVPEAAERIVLSGASASGGGGLGEGGGRPGGGRPHSGARRGVGPDDVHVGRRHRRGGAPHGHARVAPRNRPRGSLSRGGRGGDAAAVGLADAPQGGGGEVRVGSGGRGRRRRTASSAGNISHRRAAGAWGGIERRGRGGERDARFFGSGGGTIAVGGGGCHGGARLAWGRR